MPRQGAVSKVARVRDQGRASSQDTRPKKKRKSISAVQPITLKFIAGTPRGARTALAEIGSKGFLIPKKPKDVDRLSDEHEVPLDVSTVQPFQRLRDLQSYWTNEAGRVHLQRAMWKGERRRLTRRVAGRRAAVALSNPRGAKWRATAEADGDPTVLRMLERMDVIETSIEIYDALYDTYVGYIKVLSREQTAREDDRDRWYGRQGGGR